MANPSKEKMVKKTELLIQDISSLYMSQELSDVTLLVAGEQICAHKVLLAARNPYFRALLFGGLAESSKTEIELKDVNQKNLSAFKELLKYIYCGTIALEQFTPEVLLDIAALANLYNVTELDGPTIESLQAILSTDNILLVYSQAASYHLDKVVDICLNFMDKHASNVLSQSIFTNLSHDLVLRFISCRSILADEFGVFQAVQSWVRANPETDATELLNRVKLHLVPIKQIMTDVNPSRLFSDSKIMEAIEAKWKQGRIGDTRHEFCRTAPSSKKLVVRSTNFADPESGAKICAGKESRCNEDLVSKNQINFGVNDKWLLHEMTGNREDGIIIDLGCLRSLNHIQMVLEDVADKCFCYYIEVSITQEHWIRVVDHSEFHCFGSQDLYFEVATARYICIVGTKCNVKSETTSRFYLRCLAAYCTNSTKELSNGFVVPNENVATLKRGARVTYDGRNQNAQAFLTTDSRSLINIACGNYIEVQLPQPYVVNSVRFCLPKEYSYYYTVSLSVRNCNIVQVAKMKSGVFKSGWQNIAFSRPEVASAIRINPVKAVVNAEKVSHTVQDKSLCFECPSSHRN